MINELKDAPNTMVGFRAEGEITKEEFDKVILPPIAELLQRTEKLNYLFVLHAPHENMNLGGWLKEAVALLNQENKWNRAAIVTPENVKFNSALFHDQMPGEIKYYHESQLQEAVNWVGEQNGIGEKKVMQEEGTAKD